jgi:hypothetical protein
VAEPRARPPARRIPGRRLDRRHLVRRGPQVRRGPRHPPSGSDRHPPLSPLANRAAESKSGWARPGHARPRRPPEANRSVENHIRPTADWSIPVIWSPGATDCHMAANWAFRSPGRSGCRALPQSRERTAGSRSMGPRSTGSTLTRTSAWPHSWASPRTCSMTRWASTLRHEAPRNTWPSPNDASR